MSGERDVLPALEAVQALDADSEDDVDFWEIEMRDGCRPPTGLRATMAAQFNRAKHIMSRMAPPPSAIVTSKASGTSATDGAFVQQPPRAQNGLRKLLKRVFRRARPGGSLEAEEGEYYEVVLPPLPRNLPSMFGGDYQNEREEDGVSAAPITVLPDEMLLEVLARVERAAIGPAMGVCRSWRAIIRSDTFLEYRDHRGALDNYLLVFSNCHVAPTAGTTVVAPTGHNPSGAMPCSARENRLLVQAFHPRTNTWLRPQEVPAGGASWQQHGAVRIDDYSQCCALKGRVVLFPGILSKGQPPFIYDPWAHAFAPLPRPLTPRYKFVCGQMQGRLYVAGGMREQPLEGDGDRKDLRSAEMYDPGTATWHRLPDMHRLRYAAVGGCAACSSKREEGGSDRLVVLGGTRNHLQFRAEAEKQSLEFFTAPPRAGEVRSDSGGELAEEAGGASSTSTGWQLKERIPRLGFVLGAVVLGRALFVLRKEEGARISWLKYSTKSDEWKPMHEVPGIPPDATILSKVEFKLVPYRAKILILQVRGRYSDVNPQAAASARKGPLVMLYNPRGEGPNVYRRLADMPAVCHGGVCALARC